MEEQAMRIAVASTDAKTVNQHFGKAKEFLIYDLAESTPKFVEKREVTPLSVGDKEHDFDEARFNAVLDKISDCSRVYVTKVGAKPAEELQRNGIEAVLFRNAIASITA